MEDKSDVMMPQTSFYGFTDIKTEYAFFTDILKHLKCPQSYKDNFATTEYEIGDRMKRGVMENIVSAYSDIFTKG